MNNGEHVWDVNGVCQIHDGYCSMAPTTPDGQSTTPWRCENPNHAHTDERRGPKCRPDSLLHPVQCPNCEDGICTECGGDGCDECSHSGTCPDCDGTGIQTD